jgi:hypothetical protein
MDLDELIKSLESKQKDCIAFSKKYKSRNVEDLYQYYEGANWALKFINSLLNEYREDLNKI